MDNDTQYLLQLHLTISTPLALWTHPSGRSPAGFVDQHGVVYRPIVQWERTYQYGTADEHYTDLTDQEASNAGLYWECNEMIIEPKESVQ